VWVVHAAFDGCKQGEANQGTAVDILLAMKRYRGEMELQTDVEKGEWKMSRDDDWQAVFANFLGLGAKMLSWAATSESTAANKIDTASAMLGFLFGSFGASR
jgi:aminoglycoside phosphotransferase family enzyme